MRKTARSVERTLDELLPQDDGLEKRLYDAMRYAVMAGGKRLRPFLSICSAELFSVPPEYSLRVAAAIEMVHTYSLIHDDLPCMDDDEMRRGQPSAHVKFDEATAVLAGDALQALAFETLSDPATHPSPEVRCELARGLAAAIGPHGMVGGQILDMWAEHRELDLVAITRLQRLKTGALISYACEAGAILGHASREQRQSLRAYAHDLGLAFQITDDMLDHEGSEDAVGKRLGKDAEAGKATFISLLGLEEARLHAEMLSQQAIVHLEPFGIRAKLLNEISKYVLSRRA